MKKKKYIKGFNLVELMGVLVVMGILLVIGGGIAATSINHSKVATVDKALDTYKTTFISVCSEYPGVINDRLAAWSDTYTTKEGMSRLVNNMNAVLDDNLVLSWDDTLKCYRSAGTDPWGGHYILTEYPIFDGNNYYNPTLRNKKSMEISIWATGNSDSILKDNVISDRDIGVALLFDGSDFLIDNTGSENIKENDKLVTGTITMR